MTYKAGNIKVKSRRKVKIILLTINLNSDKTKAKCKYCLKYLPFHLLLNLGHYPNFMNNVKCPQIKV